MKIRLKDIMDERMSRILLYVAGGAAGVLMAAVVLCNLLLIVSSIRNPGQMPSAFGRKPAIVLSGSMEPTFMVGDVILLKKTKHPDQLEVGDVACYLYSGKATTHRVIERFEADGKPRYIMKGDYNNVEDRLAVDPEQIQGVWTGGRIPGLGRVLMFMQSTMGMFLLLICPLAGLLSWDILKRRQEDQIRREAWERGEVEADGGGAGTGRGGASRLRREWKQLTDPGRRREAAEPWTAAADENTRMHVMAASKYENACPPALAASEDENTRPRKMVSSAEDEDYRRLQEELSYYRREEARRHREEQERERSSFRRKESRRAAQDEEFAFYSGMGDDMDCYADLEAAAEHYRRMKESLARFRRMEALMNRCRKLEEELVRYEKLAERLNTYDRKPGEPNQGFGDEPPVDHINRQDRTERAEQGGKRQ